MTTIPNWTYKTLVFTVNVGFVLTVLHLFSVIELPKTAQCYLAGFSIAFMLVAVGRFQTRKGRKAPLPDRNAR